MDLLGRKAKALLEQVVEKAEQLDAYSKSLYESKGKLMREYDELYRLACLQRDAIAELSANLQSREALLADLIREIDYLKAEKETRPLPPPVRVHEEEAELEWQRDNNLISPADYQHLMEELEFQNTEVAIDPDYRPRPDLTY